MKKLLSKHGAATLAVLFCAATLTSYAIEVKKEFNRAMVPNDNTTLTVINKYGSVVTETWAEKNIVINVTVKVEHSSAEKAQKLLDMIEVKFTESGGNLNAETIFNDDFSSFSWKGDNNNFSIHYAVKMPASINLDVNNKYGNTVIDEVAGLTKLTVKYGNLTVHKLTRGNIKPLNRVDVSYGKASADELGWAEIYARYCGQFDIDKATALLVDSRYSKISVGEVSSLVADSKYDGYNVISANNIVIVSGYTNLNFEKVIKKLDVETKYGNLSVNNIPAGFEKLTVKAGYCAVKLAIDPAACYKLTANSSYGSIKVDDANFSPDKRIIGNTSSELSGKVGSCSNPASEVIVTTSYGSARLY